MSPACGYLSLFRSKRSVLVSLEGFRDRRRGPVRRLLAPVPSGPVPSGRRRPRTAGSGVLRVGRLLLGPQSLGLRCRPSCLASPSPAVPGRRFRVAGPCSRVPGRCSRAPGRCSRVARRHGRVPGSRPGAPDRQFGPGCRPGPRAVGSAGRPGCGPSGPPANMTLVSVNGSPSGPGPAAKGQTGWRCTVAYRLRSVTSPGKRAGRAPRCPLISLR
jgi:hypothetical protein